MTSRTLPHPDPSTTTPHATVARPAAGLAGRPAPRHLLTLLFAALAALLVVFATAAPAAAHDELLSTSPKAGAVLDSAPETVELTFSGDILDIGHEIHVTDSEGRDVTQGTLGVTGKTVSQPLRDSGRGDDTYTVTWRVVSQDGHPIEGKFQYGVGSGATPAPGATHEDSGHDDDHDAAPHEHSADAAASPEAGSSATASSEAVSSADAEAGNTGLPGWVLPVVGGAVVLVILLGVLFVATRPERR